MKWIIKLVINTLAVLATVWLLSPHVSIAAGIGTAEGLQIGLIVAIVLGVLNTILRPILIFLTLPATILSLGLFILVINAGMVMLADHFIDRFSVDNFWWALLFSIAMWAVQGLLGMFEKKTLGTQSKHKKNSVRID
jgi:putative membrane protein